MAEIIVHDFAELRAALTDATSTVIKFANDITANVSGGIVVPKTKGDIVIDGQGFTYHDYTVSGTANTIRMANVAGDAISVTFQNIVWDGKNNFGIFYVPANTYGSNVTLVLKDVDYAGPQAIYHRNGITRIADSNFFLDYNGTGLSAEELGEVNRLYIEGNVTVDSKSPDDAVLWFCNTGTDFVVEENAVFKVSTTNYMFYIDADTTPMTFKQNSVTDISTRSGLYVSSSTTLHMASTFTLESGASFKSIQSVRTANPSFKCKTSFVMQDGSSIFIAAPTAGTAALMYFAERATLDFNNPKSVVLYNNGGNVFNFRTGTATQPNVININAELLNMWLAATQPFETAGGFDDIPTRRVAKDGGSNIAATINASGGASGTTTAITSNVVDGDDGYPLTTATFNIMQAKVLSMGNININLIEPTDLTRTIGGSTEQSANLRAIFDGNTVNGMSDAGGTISLTIPVAAVVGDKFDFGVNWKFLTKYIKSKVLGSVSITHLESLFFHMVIVPCQRNTTVRRKKPDWYIEVTDTRIEEDSPDWYLYVSLPEPLTKGSDRLDNALMLIDGALETVMSPQYVLVKQKAWTGPEVTQISWNQVAGFLLRLLPGAYQAGTYVSTMDWQLRTSPIEGGE